MDVARERADVEETTRGRESHSVAAPRAREQKGFRREVGPKSRGLAVGLNEFAGYLAVGLKAFLTGYLAGQYGLRPVPIYLGIGYAVIRTALSVLLVRDTRDHVRLEMDNSPRETASIGFREVFALTSFRDRNLFAASQAGLVNNLNDGMSWGISARANFSLWRCPQGS